MQIFSADLQGSNSTWATYFLHEFQKKITFSVTELSFLMEITSFPSGSFPTFVVPDCSLCVAENMLINVYTRLLRGFYTIL